MEHWNKPKQGFLNFNSKTNDWFFVKGRKNTDEKILLDDFHTTADSMITNKKLFKGWRNTTHIINARLSRSLSNVVSHQIHAKHISATNLTSQTAPSSLLQHKKMSKTDKQVWDASYAKEYHGLAKCNTYKIITDEEYKTIRHKCKGILPTMAIATIKKDGEGNPIRAKYRIVVLGNLDPNHGLSKIVLLQSCPSLTSASWSPSQSTLT